MSNTNLNISINDFENLCRTCLSREDLKPLYEKCSLSMLCVAEKLMSCSFLQLAEDDGLPVKICKHCIQEINQAFSFAKRCETTDAILRNCVKIKTEFANDLSESQKRQSIIEVEDELKIDTKPEINFLNTHPYIGDVKQEDNGKLEFNREIVYRPVQEIQQQEVDTKFEEVKLENLNIDYECDGNPTNERYEEDANEMDFEKCASGSPHKRKNVCSLCSKAFTRSATLRIHMRIHSGEKPYTCEVCRKAFSYNMNLKVHMRVHTGEKPYGCKVCSKHFAHAQRLKSHMRIHTGEKPYNCKVCSRAFCQSNSLKVHMRVHTGEKF